MNITWKPRPRDAARLRCSRRKPQGHVEARMLGDITALSKDILTVPDDEIPATQVDYTIVGGKIVFQR
jgi:predicted amidohydrolase YtcJ